MSNKPLSGLLDKIRNVLGADLLLLTQNTPNGYESIKLTLDNFLSQAMRTPGTLKNTLKELKDAIEDIEGLLTNNNSGFQDEVEAGLANALERLNRHINNQDINPHPMYVTENDLQDMFSVLSDKVWPVGSWHGTDDGNYNPSVALRPYTGRDTRWRLNEHSPTGVLKPGELSFIPLAQKGFNHWPFLDPVPRSATNGFVKRYTTVRTRLADIVEDNQSLTASKSVLNDDEIVTITLAWPGGEVGASIPWNISNGTSNIGGSGNFILGNNKKAEVALAFVPGGNSASRQINFNVALGSNPSLTFTVNKVVVIETLKGGVIYHADIPGTFGISPGNGVNGTEKLDKMWRSFENKTIDELLAPGATTSLNGETFTPNFGNDGVNNGGYITILLESSAPGDILDATLSVKTTAPDGKLPNGQDAVIVWPANQYYTDTDWWGRGFSATPEPIKNWYLNRLLPVTGVADPTWGIKRTISTEGYSEAWSSRYVNFNPRAVNRRTGRMETVAPRMNRNRILMNFYVPAFYDATEQLKYIMTFQFGGMTKQFIIKNVFASSGLSRVTPAFVIPKSLLTNGETAEIGLKTDLWNTSDKGVWVNIKKTGPALLDMWEGGLFSPENNPPMFRSWKLAAPSNRIWYDTEGKDYGTAPSVGGLESGQFYIMIANSRMMEQWFFDKSKVGIEGWVMGQYSPWSPLPHDPKHYRLAMENTSVKSTFAFTSYGLSAVANATITYT